MNDVAEIYDSFVLSCVRLLFHDCFRYPYDRFLLILSLFTLLMFLCLKNDVAEIYDCFLFYILAV